MIQHSKVTNKMERERGPQCL